MAAPTGTRHGRPVPGDPRADPVRQGQLAAQCRRRAGDVPRPARLCAVPGRRPRDRLVGRGRPRRVHRGGDARRIRRGRVAGRPAVVRRRGRDVGHQLRRVHLDPGGQAATAASPRDRPDPGHRRPLPIGRPLRRRLRDGQRAVAVRGQPGGDERHAARSHVPWRRVARGMARPARGHAAVADRMAAPAARRTVLATGLAGARLRGDRGRDPAVRRLDGFVRRRRVPDAGRVHRADAHDRRQLGPRPARVGDARAERRRAPRAGPLLRSLAQGGGQRRRPRAAGRSGSSASTPTRSRSRRTCPAAGAPRRPIRIRRPIARAWRLDGGALPLVGRLVAEDGAGGTTPGGDAAADAEPASTGSATTRRSAPGRPCRGAPAGHRTASPATSDPTRRSGRPGRPIRWSTRSRSSAFRRSSSTSRCRRRWRPPSCA